MYHTIQYNMEKNIYKSHAHIGVALSYDMPNVSCGTANVSYDTPNISCNMVYHLMHFCFSFDLLTTSSNALNLNIPDPLLYSLIAFNTHRKF